MVSRDRLVLALVPLKLFCIQLIQRRELIILARGWNEEIRRWYVRLPRLNTFTACVLIGIFLDGGIKLSMLIAWAIDCQKLEHLIWVREQVGCIPLPWFLGVHVVPIFMNCP